MVTTSAQFHWHAPCRTIAHCPVIDTLHLTCTAQSEICNQIPFSVTLKTLVSGTTGKCILRNGVSPLAMSRIHKHSPLCAATSCVHAACWHRDEVTPHLTQAAAPAGRREGPSAGAQPAVPAHQAPGAPAHPQLTAWQAPPWSAAHPPLPCTPNPVACTESCVHCYPPKWSCRHATQNHKGSPLRVADNLGIRCVPCLWH